MEEGAEGRGWGRIVEGMQGMEEMLGVGGVVGGRGRRGGPT